MSPSQIAIHRSLTSPLDWRINEPLPLWQGFPHVSGLSHAATSPQCLEIYLRLHHPLSDKVYKISLRRAYNPITVDSVLSSTEMIVRHYFHHGVPDYIYFGGIHNSRRGGPVFDILWYNERENGISPKISLHYPRCVSFFFVLSCLTSWRKGTCMTCILPHMHPMGRETRRHGAVAMHGTCLHHTTRCGGQDL